jgi:hypothetical protein
MSKITLKLDEANDLNFQFKVQGTSSEPGAAAPVFRFVVFEKARQDGMGYIFPVTAKEENGTITVTIPVLKDTFKEKEPYIGKVEVIIGTRLLVPTTLELEFVKSLAIEVTPILSNEAKEEEDDRKTVEELMPEIEALERPPEVKETVMGTGKKKITMTKKQLQTLIQERRKQVQNNPMKHSLKDMMKSALSEDEDT